MRLSSTYHPIVFLLMKIPNLIPGVENAEACYKDENGDLIFTPRPNGMSAKEKSTLFDWRSKRITCYWVESISSIFNVSKSASQMSVLDEQDLRTLIITFPNDNDGLNDLIFISFHEKIGLNNVDLFFHKISTSEKRIISHFCEFVLRNIFEQIREEEKLLKGFQLTTENLRDRIKTNELRLAQLENVYSSTLLRFIESTLLECNKRYNAIFEFQEDALSLLVKSQRSLEEIKNVIQKACAIAFHLSLNKNKVLVSPDFIHWENQSSTFETKLPTSLASVEKTIELLDRYEAGAKRVEQIGITINGKNVAKNMDPEITPPAITDAVKKHKKQIAALLQEYPERWLLARKNIKPIANLDGFISHGFGSKFA